MIRSAKEVEHWKELTADMMSDEELVGEKYIRHPPSYRSQTLINFIGKLDERSEKQKKIIPRTKRELGSPVHKPVPSNAKKWMIKPDLLKERGDQECDIDDEEVGSDVLSENDSPSLSDSNSNLDISEMD